ncbi:2-aminoethylphosphonate--pyruvate transaminase [Rhodovarius crocodyli]|uniref:2-aminoethylphosphonate--pyruvate transaminase n=1 Tax=Rhodovarius crocodyli TaxID=1979269 RepID=A0A437MNU9_9PROT|nr:2-aminoethylphosphonate--pyruvate transaminase [Rhodovarius crocodyli]RVT99325.1 2-aminoethylphosphonate--pyruvate transaminase [Rhodovarius crocodyli]
MILLTPGPVQTRPETRAAAAQDIAPWDNDFRAVYARIRERVLALAGGDPAIHACLPLQGAGHFIVEATIRSLVPAGEAIIVPYNGAYADRITKLARAAGRVVHTWPVPDTRGITAEDVQAAIDAHPDARHFAMVHHETGTGIINRPEIAGPVLRAAGKRLILDSISCFGALPFTLADYPECDAVVFTSNKCIEGLPGIAFAVARTDALEAGRAGSWSFDLHDVWQHALRAGPGSFRFTPPVQALAAFGVALDLYDEEGGQPARLARYQANMRTIYEGCMKAGLRPYLTQAEQGPIIVTVHQPPGFDLQGFVDALKARGVLISNFYTTETPTIRIGCIGAVSTAECEQAMAALADILVAA